MSTPFFLFFFLLFLLFGVCFHKYSGTSQGSEKARYLDDTQAFTLCFDSLDMGMQSHMRPCCCHDMPNETLFVSKYDKPHCMYTYSSSVWWSAFDSPLTRERGAWVRCVKLCVNMCIKGFWRTFVFSTASRRSSFDFALLWLHCTVSFASEYFDAAARVYA